MSCQMEATSGWGPSSAARSAASTALPASASSFSSFACVMSMCLKLRRLTTMSEACSPSVVPGLQGGSDAQSPMAGAGWE